MMSQIYLELSRDGPHVAWGFRLQGGKEHGLPLSIQRVFNGSPCDNVIHRGDILKSVNGVGFDEMSLEEGQEVIKNAGNRLSLVLFREGNQQQNFVNNNFQPNSQQNNFQQVYQPHKQTYNQWQPEPQQQAQQWESKPQALHQHLPQQSPQNISTTQFTPSQSQASPQAPPFHKEEEEVDSGHIKPVGDIKKMFNKKDFAPTHSVPRPAPSHSSSFKLSQTSHLPAASPAAKYQPPSPCIKPAAVRDHETHTNKLVYQQKSSYNPLDFKGVNNLMKPPQQQPNRPPGLIQRGAITQHSYQPPPLSKQQQKQREEAAFYAHPSSGDPLTDFYLHGNSKKNEPMEIFKPQHIKSSYESYSTHHTPGAPGGNIAEYSGKVLPPRQEVNLNTSFSNQNKKTFNANQSAVFKILQEEESSHKTSNQPKQQQQFSGQNHPQNKPHFKNPDPNRGRLAELLERDQVGYGHFQDNQSQNQYPPFYSSQQIRSQQPLQNKHVTTSSVKLVSPPSSFSQQQPQIQSYFQHQPHHSQPQSHDNRSNYSFGTSGFPETDF